MREMVGVGYDGSEAGERYAVMYDGREHAFAGPDLLSWLLPGCRAPVGRKWLLRLVTYALDERYGKGRVYDAGQISPFIDARASVLDRTVFVAHDQMQFFEMDNCWHCDTEDEPCEVHVPEGAVVCGHFVGEGE